MKDCYSRLNPLSFGVALAIIWAAVLFIMALISHWFGYGTGFVQGMGTLYFGYHASLVGAIIGAFWAFIDAFIGGVVFAWIYNALLSNKDCCQKPE